MQAKVGDIFEIDLPGGAYAYIQYINNERTPPGMGTFVRVLPGIYQAPKTEFDDIVRRPTPFLTFFYLKVAWHQKLIRKVGHQPVPEEYIEFPEFKGFNEHIETKVKTWFLYQDSTWRRVGQLPDRYRHLPMRQIIDLKVLEDRIIAGWTPESEADDLER